MINSFDVYLNSVSKKFSHPETSEMGYRTDFEVLLKDIFQSVNNLRIDHDAKANLGNRPDFIVRNHVIPILYIEVKDLVIDLDKVEKSEQMSRYFGYANLILTDYVEFRFYRNGLPYEQQPIKIAEKDIKHRTIKPIPENFERAAKTIIDFTRSHKEPIRSGKHLAKIMGGKAQRIRDNAKIFLSADSEQNRSILSVYETIKKQLVHDLTLESFADMYAQTLVYGLFVARYHDETPENFTRQEARDLVPASNPLLRHFFDHIVGADFDKRLEFIVNELCEVFSHANVNELMKEYFKIDIFEAKHEAPDPVIHFYEDFLKEYDPALRKKLGAFYTPLPVVRFIVRSVDKILERDFGLPQGLADTSKTDKDIHKVQILDPATGTGTFISAAIGSIYERIKNSGQKGRWTSYVHHDLLPRIHGFELMMAPYTIAHLKLSMAFKTTGFKYFNRRLGIYLTNSLEESVEKDDLFASIGFAESIAEESREAAKIKNQTPIMVVIGNPPYNVSSTNKSKWIQNLIKVYKRDLNEKKTNLDDDYIKFIRFAEHFIEKNQSGIIAMITNNNFIDGKTFRQMRKHLLETFDYIYILDLHGNSKKKEKANDGSIDGNIFDIQQGVSINIMVKKDIHKTTLGKVYHAECFGTRVHKFKELNKYHLATMNWNEIDSVSPNYFFVPKNFVNSEDYDKGFKVDNLFAEYNSGVQTDRDSLFVDIEKEKLEKRINLLLSNEYNSSFKINFRIHDSSGYKLTDKILNKSYDEKYLKPIQYRPFDYLWIYYDPTIISRSGFKIYKHLVTKNNVAILISKQQSSSYFQHVFITNGLVDRCTVSLQTKEGAYTFPLYLYSDDGTKVPNLKKEIVTEIEKTVGKTSPEDILDYIYAVLHSPNYREKYKEFLKIDFPRVPYPKDKDTFKKLVALGTELRSLHLLESPKVNQYITSYPIEGTDTVEKISFEKTSSDKGSVFINKTQYFGDVPEIAWNFFIGGYQPAQKWLKDRKGRTLTNAEIEHYQKIIIALSDTHRIMNEIILIDL